MSTVSSLFKLSGFAFFTVLLLPFQIVIVMFSQGPASHVIPKMWHKIMCVLYGLRVQIDGHPYDKGSVFFVGNHVSYLDIPVIGSTIPVRFVAKKEVADWPVFGLLSKLQRTYFIDRSRMAASKEQKRLAQTISEGGRFLIFPEGTSSDGTQVLKFKSAAFSMLFDAALDEKPMVQPFSIVIKSVNGKTPEHSSELDIYAWHGDMELAPHLWTLGKHRNVDISLIFHDAFEIPEHSDRKALAAHCQAMVALPYNKKNYKVAA